MVSLTSTEVQSDFTMGIRSAMCLPMGYEVLGMETGTLSREQGSCIRSVGKLTHLTQITPSRVSQWPQHMLQTHRQSVPPPCSTGLLRGWEPLVATQVTARTMQWLNTAQATSSHHEAVTTLLLGTNPSLCFSLKKMLNSAHGNSINMHCLQT